MNIKQNGFILIIVMSMLAIMLSLTLTLMHTLLIYVKTHNQRAFQHEHFYQLETKAKNIWEHFVSTEKKVPFLSNDAVVEDLGVYSCVTIRAEQKSYASHHWLITVKSTDSSGAIVQIRGAFPAIISNCTSPVKREIHSGIISWHILYRSEVLD